MDQLKDEGNRAFSSKDYQTAILKFTSAIEMAPDNHVLYSNRSASYCALGQYDNALLDANKTIELNSGWAKGYGRKGAALLGNMDYDGAIEAYTKGLELDPSNLQLKKGLEDAQASLKDQATMGMGQIFTGDVIDKIRNNPKISGYLNDPVFVSEIQDIQKNPQNVKKYMKDTRIMMTALSLMGMDSYMNEAPTPQASETNSKATEIKKEPEQQMEVDESQPKELSEEELKVKESLKEKEMGNQMYKNRQFKEALEHYSKAWELDSTNISILTNRAAVLFEMESFEECIKTCEEAVEVGREHRADYKLMARAFARIGNAYAKMSDLDNAIKFYSKSLTEHRTADTLNKLKKAEAEKERIEKEAYFSPELSNQEREKGNELFKKGEFAEAMKNYTEAIKRNDKDARNYSNRAACYSKLMAFHEALKDCNMCIQLDPTFVKGYIRKAAIEFLKKEYTSCLETCQTAKQYDTDNKHASEIESQMMKCYAELNQSNTSAPKTEEERQEALKKAQNDPEIQKIMTDPIMQMVLQQMQQNPEAAQEHMRNPTIASNIRKLVNAGILRVA